MLGHNSKRAIVVDDDSEHVASLAVLLHDEGLAHAHVHTGGGALDLVSAETFALAIVAEDLPDASGLEVAAAIRKASPATPVIVTTSKPTRLSQKAAAAVGVSEYLTKPLNPERTGLRVRRLLMHSLPPPMPTTRSSAPPPPVEKSARADRAAARFSEIGVVVVEPLDDLRQVLMEALVAIGCAGKAFRTAALAQRQVRDVGFDLVISDPGVVAKERIWVPRHATGGRAGVIAVMEEAGVDEASGAMRLSTRGVILPPFERWAVKAELERIMLQYACSRWR